MPEQSDEKIIFSLLEVTKSIQKTLSQRYASAFWVKAEMNKLNPHPPSGHCYPELVEKKEGRIIAEINANLWKDDYVRINDLFLKVLKEPLKNGIHILFLAKIAYDPLYGLRLRIVDIDPSYSLGELEREKQETIRLLKNAGIYDRNRSLKMPLLPKRIAIISVQTSKGYSDFIQTIEKNPWGYRFFHLLFPAILQGERAVDSIISQLVRIRKVLQHFDAVAIIRGGGGEVGLTCYNNYALSREIALFPIPVITGIGHSTNETVAEMIAFKNAITPTDLADYLLQQFHNYSVPVQNAIEALIGLSGRMIREEKVKWRHSVKYFKSVTGSLLIGRHHEIRNNIRTLRQQSRLQIQLRQQNVQRSKEKLFSRIDAYLATEKKEIHYLEKNISWLDPENILRRGYSITLKDGRVVKAVAEVHQGDTLTTFLAGGKITSTVTHAPTINQP